MAQFSNAEPYGLRDFLFSQLQYFNPGYFDYWLFAGLGFLFLFIYSFIAEPKKGLVQDSLYFFLIFVCLFLFKWPDLFRFELNPDESFSIVAGMNLYVDPVYWRSFAGGTHGPLIHFPLVIPKIFGLSIDFASARCTGIVFFTGTFFFVKKILELFIRPYIAKLAVLSGILLYAMCYTWDFTAYNGEHVVVFFVTISSFLALKLHFVDLAKLNKSILVLGLLLGMLPFTKIQSMPAGIAIGTYAMFIILARHNFLTKKAFRSIIYLIIGTFSFPAILLLFTYFFGAIEEFWNSFILQNFAYANRHQFSLYYKIETYIISMVTNPNEISEFIFTQLIFIICSLPILALFFRRNFSRYYRILVCFFLFLLINIYKVAAPGNGFYHYALFLITPFVLISGIILGVFFESIGENKKSKVALLSFYVVICIFFAGYRYNDRVPRVFYSLAETHKSLNQSNTARLIRALSKKEDSLTVWGWADYIYIQTGLYSATRYSTIFLLVTPSYLQERFISQFLKDFDTPKNYLFVDSVGPNHFMYTDRRTLGYETLPRLKRIIDEKYHYLVDIESNRIFVKKKRWKKIRKALNLNSNFPILVKNSLQDINSQASNFFGTRLEQRVIGNNYFAKSVALLDEMLLSGEVTQEWYDYTISNSIVASNIIID